MDLLAQLSLFAQIKKFEETNNYYYTYHNCPQNGENTKIQLDYTLSTDLSDDIIKLGTCPHCHTGFYHRDHDSRTF